MWRHISNLSFISKLGERLVAEILDAYVAIHHLLPAHQSVYRKCHLTEILSIHNNIEQSIDEDKICAQVLLDMSAAFDTVDHAVLLDVLKKGLEFEIELSNGHSSLSRKKRIKYAGVFVCRNIYAALWCPQASVIGPKYSTRRTSPLFLMKCQLISHHF